MRVSHVRWLRRHCGSINGFDRIRWTQIYVCRGGGDRGRATALRLSWRGTSSWPPRRCPPDLNGRASLRVPFAPPRNPSTRDVRLTQGAEPEYHQPPPDQVATRTASSASSWGRWACPSAAAYEVLVAESAPAWSHSSRHCLSNHHPNHHRLPCVQCGIITVMIPAFDEANSGHSPLV